MVCQLSLPHLQRAGSKRSAGCPPCPGLSPPTPHSPSISQPREHHLKEIQPSWESQVTEEKGIAYLPAVIKPKILSSRKTSNPMSLVPFQRKGRGFPCTTQCLKIFQVLIIGAVRSSNFLWAPHQAPWKHLFLFNTSFFSFTFLVASPPRTAFPLYGPTEHVGGGVLPAQVSQAPQ